MLDMGISKLYENVLEFKQHLGVALDKRSNKNNEDSNESVFLQFS